MIATFCMLDVFALLVRWRCYICVELHCRSISAFLGVVVSLLLNMIDGSALEVSFSPSRHGGPTAFFVDEVL